MENKQLLPFTKKELFISILLAGIQIAHVLDFVIIMPLGAVLMEELQITTQEFGGLVSSYNFAAAFSGLFVGLIADKFERKSLLLVALFAFILGTLGCSFSTDFETFLTLRILTGIAGGGINGLVLALVADFIPLGIRGRAIGIVLSAFSISSVVGVPIGLAISDYYGWRSSFYFVAGLALLILIFATLYLPKVGNFEKKVTLKEFLSSYGKVITNFKYLYSYIFLSLFAFSLFLMIPFINPYAVKNMAVAQSDLKYMYFFGGILTVICARLFGVLTDRYGPHKIMTLLVFVSIIPVLYFGHAGPTYFAFYIFMGSLFMAFVSGRMIPAMTLLSEVPLEKDRGRFMAILNSFRATGVASAALISGFIVSETNNKIINYDWASYLSTLLTIIALIMGLKIKFNSSQS